MKLTNKHGIPQTFVNVLKRPEYSKGKAHLSATQLINSPKIVALTKKFDDQIEQDVSELIWPLWGSAMHKVLEHGKDENHIVEQRYHAELDGWQISGAVDLQIVHDKGISIRDYKTVSVWSVLNAADKIEWEQQLNIYAYLVEKNRGTPVTDLGIVAIIRDWSRKESERKEDYPAAPIKELPIKLWTMQEREDYILHRIAQHSACEFAMETDGDLPACTPEEMWEKPTSWAVKKTGGVRAKSVHETEAEAQAALEKAGKDYEIEVRPGSRTRCESFCPVNPYCQQWRDYQESKK